MRALTIFSLVALFASMPLAQTPADQSSREQELLARLRKLEEENLRLRTEVDRLRALETDLRHLKLLGRDHADETPDGSAPQPMPGMPYDEDLYFVVTGATTEGSQGPNGVITHTVTVDVLELAPKARKDAKELGRDGWTWVALGSQARAEGRPYRIKLEDMKPGQARRWLETLRPRPETGPEGVVTTLHRRIGFNRVKTDASYMGRYPGNSGTVRIHRKKLHWYENSVFFLENGVLRLRGDKATRYHLRLFAPLDRR